MAFGIIDTRFVDLQNGITDTQLRSMKTGSGLALEDVVVEVDNAMAQINEGIDPRVASLIGFTTVDEAGKHRTERKVVQRGGQFTVARPQRGGSAGHPLGLHKFEAAIGFTEDGLWDMSMEDIRGELSDLVDAWQRVYVTETFDRQFDPASKPVNDKGTSIVNPGFIGSGVAYNGVRPDGSSFDGSYTHYVVTTAANLETALDVQLGKLLKLHPTASYDMIGTPGAIAKVRALSGAYVAAGSALIRRGDNSEEALVDTDNYIGVLLERIRVRPGVEGIFDTDANTEWLTVYATYGPLSTRNPLAYRYDARRGRRAYVRDRSLYPMTNASALQWFGINVWDRLGATLTMIHASETDYRAPVILP